MKKLFAVVLCLASLCHAQTRTKAVFIDTQITVAFSATPTFDASKANVFKITLTGNVTSSTLSNALIGQELIFDICQDGTGGRTFVPPANVLQWSPISSTASACSVQFYTFDGTNALPDMMPGLTGDVTSPPGSTTTTVAKVNGVSFPSGPSTHSVPVTTAANTETYKVVPDCTDATGNHINYTQSTDAWSCGTSVPANVVTLTGTQTPTNKTFTGASTGNSINLFSSGCPPQGNTGSITGTGAAANLYTCPLQANAVENLKVLHIMCSGFHDTGTANPSITVNLNGQNILSISIGIVATQSYAIEAYVLRTGTTTAETWGTVAAANTASFSTSVTGLAWTSSQTLNCQFNVAATDHVTGRTWIPASIQ
jgi:hypothetical protein